MNSIVAFPMYDFPELDAVYDELWSALRGYLLEEGVDSAPTQLTRGIPHEQVWAHPNLLLGQACEYPLAKRFAGRLRHVATPCYGAPGCAGANYRSAIVVRADDPAKTLEELRGRRCVINEWTSNSGMNLLRAAIAPIARGGRFFESVEVSGSHRRSVEAVSKGAVDVAAIDCVTLAHLRRLIPSSVAPLRILTWTPSSPSLPLVTAATTDDQSLAKLRSALRAVAGDPVMTAMRRQLLLEGFDLCPEEGFSEVLRLEQAASQRGYPTLH